MLITDLNFYGESYSIREAAYLFLSEAGPTPNKTKQMIRKAIDDRRELRIYYVSPNADTANPNGWRIVHPHAFGYSGGGGLLMRAWQPNVDRGISFSKHKPEWRLFRTDGITKVELLNTHFQKHPDFRKGDRSMVGGLITEL